MRWVHELHTSFSLSYTQYSLAICAMLHVSIFHYQFDCFSSPLSLLMVERNFLKKILGESISRKMKHKMKIRWMDEFSNKCLQRTNTSGRKKNYFFFCRRFSCIFTMILDDGRCFFAVRLFLFFSDIFVLSVFAQHACHRCAFVHVWTRTSTFDRTKSLRSYSDVRVEGDLSKTRSARLGAASIQCTTNTHTHTHACTVHTALYLAALLAVSYTRRSSFRFSFCFGFACTTDSMPYNLTQTLRLFQQ